MSLDKLREQLESVRQKLETGPTTQSQIMRAWDAGKALILEQPGSSLPREIFESIIEEVTEQLDAIIQSLGENAGDGIIKIPKSRPDESYEEAVSRADQPEIHGKSVDVIYDGEKYVLPNQHQKPKEEV